LSRMAGLPLASDPSSLEHRCFPQIPEAASSDGSYENRCGPICQETGPFLTICIARNRLYNGELGDVTGKSKVVLRVDGVPEK
jgi:hypothetical protein